MSGNAEKIIALDKERMQAMADKDVGKLKQLLCKGPCLHPFLITARHQR